MRYTTLRMYECVSICTYNLCGPVCMRYRSSETNYHYEYRYKCVSYGCLLTANKVRFVVAFVVVVVHKCLLMRAADTGC